MRFGKVDGKGLCRKRGFLGGGEILKDTMGQLFPLLITRRREKLLFNHPNTLLSTKVKDVITTEGTISNPLTTNVPFI